MAHKINNTNGKDSFFSVKERAWHGLGQLVQECPNSEEAIKLAGLDFEVKLAPLYAAVGGEVSFEKARDLDHIVRDKNIKLSKGQIDAASHYFETKKLPINFATYRTDTLDVFGVVGNRYTIVQNKDAFNFFDSIVGEGAAIFETAGALGRGEIIFITAKLPGYISVKGKDDIEKYLLFTSSHDGSGSVQAMFTPIRVVCNNTLQIALSMGTNKIRLRHTKDVKNKIEEAHKLMGISHKLIDELGEVYNHMANKGLNGEEVEGYIKKAMNMKVEEDGSISTRTENKLNEVLSYFDTGPGQELVSARGTVWGAYNAITGYYNNVKDWDSNDDKMRSMYLGAGATVMERALNLGVQLADGISVDQLN